ncbi:MAG: L,D-transpeptidase [Solirubrobacterales bacterium]
MKARALVPVGGFFVAALLALPAGVLAQGGGGGGAGGGGEDGAGGGSVGQKPAKISVKLKGVDGGRVDVGDRVRAIGKVRPFVGGQEVEVRLGRKGDVVEKKTPFVRRVKNKNYGRVKLKSKPLVKAGKYRVRVSKAPTPQQAGGRAKSQQFRLRFPDLDPGDSGPAVALFNDLLRKRGYYSSGGNGYSSRTGRAVMAFRKVNGMARNFQATPGIFQALAAGKGSFKLRYPNAGRHVEVDLSKQVMVLAGADGKPQWTFHVSTGTIATPSDQGGYSFYRREPGYNNVRMYYSVYYNGGEAIHGYHSVPPHPASHGCIRNPIPDSVFIYNWVELGMKIWVYN